MDSTSTLTTAHSSDFDKDTNNLVNLLVPENNVEIQPVIAATLPKTAEELFSDLLNIVEKVDFESIAFNSGTYIEKAEELKPPKDFESITMKFGVKDEKSEKRVQTEQPKKLSSFVLTKKHYIVICIEELLKIAKLNNWGLCKKNGNIYLYNGTYWIEINKERFEFFLGEVALKMGVEKFVGKFHAFKSELYKQFMADAYLTTSISNKEEVLINLMNGTFEIMSSGRGLRRFDQNDFLTHQLSFDYIPKATAPQFQKYLDEVLPDKDKQKVLAEYIGYIFIKPGILKLEKVLLLFGTGANGKSVFFEIMNALLGKENISNYSLANLTNDNGYFRAKLSGKLLNYASELTANFEMPVFKQMASGEPIEARLPYKEPIILTDYAKLMFNCNELPKEVEHTNAFFRRFLIINFDVTIPECKQDKQLSKKIIDTELSGVFNWALEGLDRLLNQKNFSKCTEIENARIEYEKQSDTVQLFILENGFNVSTTNFILISDLHKMYKTFCIEEGYKLLGKSKFIERLNNLKYNVKRINLGNIVYLSNDIPKT